MKQKPGTYVVKWDGKLLPSGIYFVKLKVDDIFQDQETTAFEVELLCRH